MKRNLRFLRLVVLFLIPLLAAPAQAAALRQGNGAVTVFDSAGQPLTALTDGDALALEVSLPAPVPAALEVTFRLAGSAASLAGCSIPAGKQTCRSATFPALGWYWNEAGNAQPAVSVQAYAGADLLGASASLAIRPRPVVLVHGFISSYETFHAYLGPQGFLAQVGLQGFAVGDGQIPGVLNTGNASDPAARTNSVAQNAEVLRQYIQGVKDQTGAQMVDLVVHSMGGMISRYYIDRVMAERDVAQLIMFGSPMGGSDCTVLTAALGFALPGSLEIRQAYMQGVFNRQITHRKGIAFYDLAGTAILEPFKAPCTAVPSDLVVARDSVTAIPLEHHEFPALHSDLHALQETFDGYALPLLKKPAGSFQDVPDPQPPAGQSAPLQFTRVYTGQVPAGGAQDLKIQIDQDVAVASFALYDPTRSLGIKVLGASGNEIELSTEKNGFIQVDDPSTLVYLGYGFQNPKPGPWQVTLLATPDTPSSGAQYAISVYFIGGAELKAQTSTLVPAPGETVTISASLDLGSQPLEITQAQALVRQPDGVVQTVDFQPGQTISAGWQASLPGPHGIDLLVTGRAPDGSPVERTAFLALEVQPGEADVRANRLLVGGMAAGAFCLLTLVLAGVGLAFWMSRRKSRARR